MTGTINASSHRLPLLSVDRRSLKSLISPVLPDATEFLRLVQGSYPESQRRRNLGYGILATFTHVESSMIGIELSRKLGYCPAGQFGD
jgi:hypothetical protein